MAAGTIITDGRGRPLTPPDPPGMNASADAFVDYLRAFARHRDEVSAVASGAFARRFRKGRR